MDLEHKVIVICFMS